MDYFFYELGILYFAVSIYNFLHYDYNRCFVLGLNSNTSDLTGKLEKKEEGVFKKHYPRKVVGFMFFVWTYIGCVGGFPEGKFFILNLIVSVSYFAVVCVFVFYIALRTYKAKINACDFIEQQKDIKNPIKLTKIVYFLEIILVGAILTIHYFIL
jgi:hypothetical protein